MVIVYIIRCNLTLASLCLSVTMHTATAQFLLLLAAREVLSRQGRKEDVIWFPIEEVKGGYQSYAGEVYLDSQQSYWYNNGDKKNVYTSHFGNRNSRSVPLDKTWNNFNEWDIHKYNTANNNFDVGDGTWTLFGNDGEKQGNAGNSNFGFGDMPWSAISDNDGEKIDSSSIVFPGETNADEVNSERRLQACQKNCPQTYEYNPVCGSDKKNYDNRGTLRCAQLCGINVSFVHNGICGRGLPMIFRPSPRPPRKFTASQTRDGTVNNWRPW